MPMIAENDSVGNKDTPKSVLDRSASRMREKADARRERRVEPLRAIQYNDFFRDTVDTGILRNL